jgi:hypothetical protein
VHIHSHAFCMHTRIIFIPSIDRQTGENAMVWKKLSPIYLKGVT